MDDPLLSMVVAVEHHYEASAAAVWQLLTDIPRMAELSPEVVEASWMDETTFRARNQRGGMEWEVTGHVLTALPTSTFVWCISDPALPSSTWRYDVSPAGPGTHVRQTFRHGPGGSMVRRAVADGADPVQVMAWRSAMLAADMKGVLVAAEGLLP